MQIDELQYRSNNYLQLEELFLDWQIACNTKKYLICRLKNCLQIEELFAGERIVCRLSNYDIGRLKNDLQMKEVFDLQVEEVSTDWRTIYRSKNHIWSKNYICRSKGYIRSADWKTICKPQNYWTRLRNYVRSKNYIRLNNYICRLKNYIRSNNYIRSRNYICRWRNILDLQMEELSADHRIVYKLRKYLICKSKKYLWIQEMPAGKILICRS